MLGGDPSFADVSLCVIRLITTYRHWTQPVVVRQQLQGSEEVEGRHLAQAVQRLEKTHDCESRARLRITSGSWPPAYSHQLLPPLDPPVAVAEINIHIVDTGDVDDHEALVRFYSGQATISGRVPELNHQTKALQVSAFKKLAVPLLCGQLDIINMKHLRQ
jgi:hypothetical protein